MLEYYWEKRTKQTDIMADSTIAYDGQQTMDSTADSTTADDGQQTMDSTWSERLYASEKKWYIFISGENIVDGQTDDWQQAIFFISNTNRHTSLTTLSIMPNYDFCRYELKINRG